MGHVKEPILLGVEVEFEVINNPAAPSYWEAPYPTIVSYPKWEAQPPEHDKHGNIGRDMYARIGDCVKLGYDWTASPRKYDGIELYGDPADLRKNKDMWRHVYEVVEGMVGNSPRGKTEYNKPCATGMHVHVSGPISKLELGRITWFINNSNNAAFINAIAGRYNHAVYCKIQKVVPPEQIEWLYHSKDCKNHPDKPIELKDHHHHALYPIQQHYVEVAAPVTYNYTYDTGGPNAPLRPVRRMAQRKAYCCQNAALYMTDIERRAFVKTYSERNAMNLLPSDGTGLFELRLFTSPLDIETFNARLEWVESVVRYCQQETDLNKLLCTDYIAWLMNHRTEYHYLFKMMVGLGFLNKVVKNIDDFLRKPQNLTPKSINEILQPSNSE